MSIIFGDGFDQYNSISDMNKTRMYLRVGDGSYVPTLSTTVYRTGTKSVRCGSVTGSGQEQSGIIYILPDVRKTIGISVAFNVTALSTTLSPVMLFNDTTSNYHIKLQINTNGGIDLVNGSTSTIIQSSTDSLISVGTWYHIELLATIDGSLGYAEVRLNGNTTPIIQQSNISTINGSNDWTSKIFFGRTTGNSNSIYIDDLVIWDTNGTENNDFLGPVYVGYLQPSGDSGTNTMIPDSGLNLYSRVGEISPDGDSSYVSAPNQNDVMNLSFPNVDPSAKKVYAVITNIYSKKVSSGSSSIQSGLNGTLSKNLYQDFSYQFLQETFNKNPQTNSKWTLEDVNSIIMNVKRNV